MHDFYDEVCAVLEHVKDYSDFGWSKAWLQDKTEIGWKNVYIAHYQKIPMKKKNTL